MRILFVVLLLSFAGLAALLWRDPPPAPAPVVPQPGAQPASTDPTAGVEVATNPIRDPIARSTGSIAGTLVDTQRRPIAEARVFAVVADARVLPGVTTDAAGRFTLFEVPPGPVAIRAEAARFVTVQLGDLFPERSDGKHLELGDLVLADAVTWSGTVRSGGVGVGGATVMMVPDLGAPGTPTPLTQSTTTEADGAFVFVSGIHPPCTMIVDATGFRRHVRGIEHANEHIDFTLWPSPRVRGRVVADDGSPLPQARIFVQVSQAPQPPESVHPHPDPHPSMTHPVEASGAFDLPAPEGHWLIVHASADERIASVLGPFLGADDIGPLTFVLARGCTVRGSVTWRGDPIHASATLWSVPPSPTPVHTVSIGGNGTMRLPPVPPGRYRLVVAAERGAHCERELDLTLGADTPLAIALPEGTRLVGTVRGERPASSAVLCTHESGLRRRGLVRGDGTFLVEGLGPGRWRTDVIASYEDFRSQCDTLLTALLDEPWLVVAAQSELEHTVVSASLRLGSLRGTLPPKFAGARLELVPGDDQQKRIPIGLRQVAIGDDGSFALVPVLPGTWLVRLVPRDGSAPLERTVVVVAGTPTEVTFP